MASSPEWKDRCAQALRKNLPETTVLSNLKYRYTCPSNEGGAYLLQWLWDSCFHAMTYRWFDPEMAWEELLSLLTHRNRQFHPICHAMTGATILNARGGIKMQLRKEKRTFARMGCNSPLISSIEPAFVLRLFYH